jgi:tRNA U34 5-methylaminomethyl-2-thiouridine-forming methyltransferase MnmC
MKKAPYIIDTSDGSHSIYIPALNETYHSSHGAITESIHVFIKAGLNEYSQQFKPQEINVFEVGFGTGLNALLAMQWAAENKVKLNYHSIEQFPVAEEVYQKLNYGKLSGNKEAFLKIHQAAWDKEVPIAENFLIKKIYASWNDFALAEKAYQIVFYDAFAPGKQPEMWDIELLQKSYNGLKENGMLVSYCARGQFKRDLKSCGFVVETLPGPPGKKEMVRGRKI